MHKYDSLTDTDGHTDHAMLTSVAIADIDNAFMCMCNNKSKIQNFIPPESNSFKHVQVGGLQKKHFKNI